MAEVWRAVYEPTDTQIAVKVSSVLDPSFVAALHGEASVMASFRTPYLVTVHDFGLVDRRAAAASQGRLQPGAAWLAMEWLPHGTLAAPSLVGDWGSLRRVLLDLLLGLAHAHARGVLHRDVKPANVLVASLLPLRVKLADFGVAFAREQWLAGGAAPSAALTPRYAAPEQIRTQVGYQGPWTDLYLLGCVARQLATGEVPFAAHTDRERVLRAQLEAQFSPLEARFDVPAGFGGWVERLLQKQPGDRFLTAPAAIDALLAVERINRLHRRHWSAELDPESPPPVGAGDPGPGVFANRKAPFVGRTGERDRLWELLYTVTVDPRPRVVLAHGPSGVGTSALASWLVERVLETGAATVAVSSESRAAPLADLVAHRLGDSVLRQSHRTGLTVHLGSSEPWVADLASWLSGERRPERADRFSLAARALAHGGAPVIVWIDGYIEGELLAFARWATATRALPALFLFTDADDRLAGNEPARGGLEVERMALAPLEPETIVQLVQSFGSIDQGTAVRIADRSDGFPRLAVEILRSLAATKGLRPGEAGWRASRKRPLPVPEGATTLGDQRLDDVLARVPRSLPALAVAGVLGMDGTTGEWELVCRKLKILIPAQLVPTLLRLRLLADHGRGHRLSQPALVDAILRRTVVRHPALHRAAAEILEARGDHPVRIGRHLLGAGDRDGARAWLVRGMNAPGDLVRLGVALDLLEELIPPDDLARAPILFKRIERARVSGRVDAALEAIRKLLVLARRHGDASATARALMQRAVLRVEGGDNDGAVRDASEAAALVERVGAIDQDTAQTGTWYGLVLARIGRLAEARAVLETRSGYLRWYGLGMVALDEGHPTVALEAFEQAKLVVGSDRLNAALLQSAVAESLCETGRLDSAEQLAADAVSKLVELQSTYVGDARVCLGYVHLAQSRWAAAELALRSALVDNEDARRAALAGLALATAGLRRDPLGWLQLFDPRGLRMSLSRDRTVARALDRLADLPGVTTQVRTLAQTHASAVLALARPVG
jgi:tetratricopeptide (TPR) repeat protein